MTKNIILCCDGTGQKFERNKANPLRLHYCLHNSDQQVSFYDPGVGIVRNIQDAYRYLMQVYNLGDRVYLFGFSTFEPDYAGKLHDSYTGWWQWLGTHVRTIPEHASIHASAVRRREEAIDGYAPRNWP